MLASALLLIGAAGERQSRHSERTNPATLSELAAAFVPNRGQWDDKVRYAAWKKDVAAVFSRDSIRFSRTDGPSVALRFRGAKRSAQLVGDGEREGRYNFIFGDDPSQWRTGVAGFRTLAYRGLYDGIDLEVVDPGVEWATFLGGAGDESIRGLEIARDGTGDIVVAGQTASPDFPRTRGNLTPVGWTPYVARMNAAGTELVYSTFFGGSFNHSVQDVGLDSQSRPAVVGDTNSLDFPTTPGAYDRTPGNGFQGDYDAYVIKFEADGSGPVVGITSSSSFPTTAGAYDRVFSAGVTSQTQDVFISRLSPDGSGLTYSTFFGGDGLENVYDMVLDPQGVLTFGGKVSNFFDQPVTMPTTADAFD